MKIIILTATYNRRNNISELYQSLLAQSYHEFKWIVIDDGSTDGTEHFFQAVVKRNNPFQVKYFLKENGGKSRALNYGFSKIDSADFVIIIDDDEVLYKDAMETVASYVCKYYDSDCVGMEFLRDIKGQPIANYPIRDDFKMGIRERKRKRLVIDGYTGYFWKKMNDLRFPEFENEKYVGPGVLQMLSEERGTWLWPKVSLGNTEYLENGITKKGRLLRVNNPYGMIYYCVLHQHKDSGIIVQFKYSAMAYAYMRCNGIKKADLLSSNIDIRRLNKMAYIPGQCLAIFWRKFKL